MLKVQQVTKVLRVIKVLKVMQVQKEVKVQRVYLEQKEIQVRRVQKVLLVIKVKKVVQAPQVQKVQQVLKEIKEIEVEMVTKVTKVTQDLKVMQELKVLGYKRLILRSDQEEAIMALKKRVQAEWGDEMMLEESPVGESQSNGVVEKAVQDIQGQFRTLKEGLEERTGKRVPGDNAILAWMVKHAGQLINRYRVREDGRTSHERIRGKKFRREVAEFGECVWYLKPGSKGKHKMDSRWGNGV